MALHSAALVSHYHFTPLASLLVSPQLGIGVKTFVTRCTLVLFLVNDHVSVEAVSVLEHFIALVASVLTPRRAVRQGNSGGHVWNRRRPGKSILLSHDLGL